MMRAFIFQAYQKFLSFNRKKQIFLVVWTVHLFFLCSLWIHHFAKRSYKPHARIAVRTIQPKILEAPTHTVASTKKPEKLVPAKTSSNPKKNTPKPIPSASNPKENPNALKEIKEALKELKGPQKTKSSMLAVPSEIQMIEPTKEMRLPQNYSEYLVAYLEETLDLPEYGTVKLALRIDRTGKLLQSEILSSENRKNSEFLKNKLPELVFPCFNDFDIEETALTFTVSFRNAEVR